MFDSKRNLWLHAAFLLLCVFRITVKCDVTEYLDSVELRDVSPNIVVNSMIQDSRGYMWFGTSDGLIKYDGYSFITFRNDPTDLNSLSDNSITHLILDREDHVWIGTITGAVDRFDPQSERFKHYAIDPYDPGRTRGSPIENFYVERQGTVWVFTSGCGLNYLDKREDNFIRLKGVTSNPYDLQECTILQALEDSEDVFWISVKGAGLAHLDNKTGKITPVGKSKENIETGTTWGYVILFEDSGNNLWAQVWGDGLFRYDRESGKFIQFEEMSEERFGPGAKFISYIIEDQSNNLWIGTNGSGLIKFNLTTNNFTHYLHDSANPQSLNDNTVTCIYEDRSETIWIGTKKGLNKYSKYRNRFNRSTYQIMDKESGINDYVLAIHEDSQKNLWLGTAEQGLIKYDFDNGNHETFNLGLEDGQYQNPVYALHDDKKGNLYIGTATLGLFRLKIEEEITEQLSEPLFITSICEDKSGIIWVGTRSNGLGRLNGEDLELGFMGSQPNNTNTLTSSSISTLYEDSEGNLWIGTDGGGLNKLSRDRKMVTHYRYHSKNANSLSDDRVTSIFEDDTGFLWIGTLRGLNRFDTHTGELKRFYEKDGLPADMVCGIIQDNGGHLWMSTNQGLAEFDLHTSQCRLYDMKDGLTISLFSPGAHCKSTSGKLFFGGMNSFCSFYPDDLKDNSHVPNIVITSFRVFDEEKKYPRAVDRMREIILPHSENYFSFEYAALDFVEPSRNLYAYKLDGVDKDWIYCGNRRYSSYTQIAPGNYVFQVKGSNSDGVWNEVGASVRVVIIPPFWMTWEFRILAALVALAFIVGFYKLKMRSIKRQRDILEKEVEEKREAERKLLANQVRLRSLASELTLAEERERRRISRALHDQIGHALSLSQIKLAALSEDVQADYVAEPLKEAIDLINDAVDNTRTLTVDISPPTLYEFGFEAAAENLVERMGKRYKLTTAFESPASRIPLSDEISVTLYQVLRELVVNVIKHSEADLLRVSTSYYDNWAKIKIKDNGKGFDTKDLLKEDVKPKGLGLYSIRERLDSFGGKLIISSKLGAGTEITVIAPLSEEEDLHR